MASLYFFASIGVFACIVVVLAFLTSCYHARQSRLQAEAFQRMREKRQQAWSKLRERGQIARPDPFALGLEKPNGEG